MRLVYGRHPVEALLEAKPRDVRRLFVSDGAEGHAVALAERAGVPVERVPRARLESLARGPHHQNLVAEAQEFRYADLEALVPEDRPALVLALDSVQDPHNLGALARSAECLGGTGLLMARDRSAPVSPVALKSSAGALERLPVAQVVNLVRALESLKERGVWVVGLAGEGAEELRAVDLSVPTALVVGAEGEGLRPLVRRTCDRLARIPLTGRTGSLNASVAGAVALYEALRQRSALAPAVEKA
jgi:23S rRNA (guanosine2251-2'-O)-methyltransferase